MEKKFILVWQYTDGSCFGSLPKILTEKEKELIELVNAEIGLERPFKFVEIEE